MNQNNICIQNLWYFIITNAKNWIFVFLFICFSSFCTGKGGLRYDVIPSSNIQDKRSTALLQKQKLAKATYCPLQFILSISSSLYINCWFGSRLWTFYWITWRRIILPEPRQLEKVNGHSCFLWSVNVLRLAPPLCSCNYKMFRSHQGVVDQSAEGLDVRLFRKLF